MGNVDDTVLMVESIRKKFPDNFLGLAGLSAGSGQVSFSSSLSSAQNVPGLNLKGGVKTANQRGQFGSQYDITRIMIYKGMFYKRKHTHIRLYQI